MKSSTDFIATTDPEGHLKFLNPAGRKMTGRDGSEGIRTTCLADYHTAATAPLMASTALPQAGRAGSWTGESVLRGKEGREIPVMETIVAHKDSKGRVKGYSIIARDLTETKEAERKLRECEQSLRELSIYVLQSQEEERRRISRDLHDSTSQSLTGILARLHIVNKCAYSFDATTQKLLAESLKMAESAAGLIRTFSSGSHPLVLDEQGLLAALRWYADGLAAQSKVRVEIESPANLSRLPREVERSLYRIAQESITRIRLLSPSAVVKVRLVSTPEKFVLEIREEGSQSQVAASATLQPAPHQPDITLSCQPNASGVGLASSQSMLAPIQKERRRTSLEAASRAWEVGFKSMQERMRQLGGWIENNSGTNGTMVRAILPLAPQAPALGILPANSAN